MLEHGKNSWEVVQAKRLLLRQRTRTDFRENYPTDLDLFGDFDGDPAVIDSERPLHRRSHVGGGSELDN